MKKPLSILNEQQQTLVDELTGMYGIEKEQIFFFENDSKPFLTYEANAQLCNQLTNLIHIGVEPVPSAFADSVAVKCSIAFQNGNERSAIGVANLSEKVDEDFEISEQQAMNLASSRALRNVLRTAGIDLLKLHQQAISGENNLAFRPKSNFVSLLGQAHQLGKEAGLIVGEDKTAWYAILRNRYGVDKSNHLTEDMLANFVAFLGTLTPQFQKLAA